MTVPVLTAVTGSPWEAQLVAGLESGDAGVTVVRRCVDVAELLAVAVTGTARAVLLSAELRRLDRDALARLASAGTAVVGLFTPGDEAAEMRLRQLGIAHVIPADAPAAAIATTVGAAMAALAGPGPQGRHAFSQPLAGLHDLPPTEPAVPAAEPGAGRLIAVWGPTGGPGRTTVAVGVAGALAASGVPTLLADADVYGGVVAQALGLLDEAPGLAAAARLANNGNLDVPALARSAPQVVPGLRVLTGISRAERWPELRPAALEQVWGLARSLAAVTVVDCGFCLEQDEELSFDTAAPRRNGATLTTLAAADTVLAVGTADPVGMQRLVRGLEQLRDAVPDVAPRVVLNRVRAAAVGAHPERQLGEALDRYVGLKDVWFVPEDRATLDAALLQGRLVTELAANSAVARAFGVLASAVMGREAPPRRRRRLRVSA